jgi:RNA polymerase sigma-70 factor (sigma-E family)
MLTGDRHAAEDLVQTALAKSWPRWSSITRDDVPEVYVKRVMLNTFISWRRRLWRREVPSEDTRELAGARVGADVADIVATRRILLDALAGLPPGQRAVIVLRYFDDLSERETADLIGVSVGTVKSQTSKAISRLRANDDLRGLTRRASLRDESHTV